MSHSTRPNLLTTWVLIMACANFTPSLRGQDETPHPNDLFSKAILLQDSKGTQLNISLDGCTTEMGEPLCGGSLWWRFEPQRDQAIKIEYTGPVQVGLFFCGQPQAASVGD